MPTQGTNDRQSPLGLGAAVKEVAERTSAIVRLELELAAMELKRKVASLGVGIGLLLGAALFLVFMLAFVFATIAAGPATTMPLSAAVTTGILCSPPWSVPRCREVKKGTPRFRSRRSWKRSSRPGVEDDGR
jgi:hypothetical protein